jgi:type VI secretion system protein ImpH
MSKLLDQGHAFSFVQVMRLARIFLDSNGIEGFVEILWQTRVEIQPELSLAFPAADIARVERAGDGLRVTGTFLGFYGSSSPKGSTTCASSGGASISSSFG